MRLIVPLLRQSDADPNEVPDWGDCIDASTFGQILEMDDDEDVREFSKSIVYGFFDQAVGTFKNMQTNMYVSQGLFMLLGIER